MRKLFLSVKHCKIDYYDVRIFFTRKFSDTE